MRKTPCFGAFDRTAACIIGSKLEALSLGGVGGRKGYTLGRAVEQVLEAGRLETKNLELSANCDQFIAISLHISTPRFTVSSHRPLTSAPAAGILGPMTTASPATTHADDLAAARDYLRSTVDDETASHNSRLAAATQLAKLSLEQKDDPVAERKAMQLSDNELLLVIEDARTRREATRAGGTLLAKGTHSGDPPLAPPPAAAPGPAAIGVGLDDFDWSVSVPEVPRGTPTGMDGFDALFADVPDLEPASALWD